jgi:hypothetical protein
METEQTRKWVVTKSHLQQVIEARKQSVSVYKVPYMG